MRSVRHARFKKCYDRLPVAIQREADKAYELWKQNPNHPSLQFKCVKAKENLWSDRVTLGYRALGVRSKDIIVWLWIGVHTGYEQRV